MRHLLRPLALILAVLLVPIVPFVLLGEQFEAQIWTWFTGVSPEWLAAAVIGLHAVDMFLPIPSSLVSTLAGARLGIVGGAAASWLGMTIGAVAGFALARLFGEAIARRFSHDEDIELLRGATNHYGPLSLAVSRPLPILAEATVLLVGAMRLPWRKFLPVVMLSNLGIAVVYSTLGAFSFERGQLALAAVASIALPLVATLLARRTLQRIHYTDAKV